MASNERNNKETEKKNPGLYQKLQKLSKESPKKKSKLQKNLTNISLM